MLLRADNLQNLTPADVGRLESLGVRLVVDLRTAHEVRMEGDGPLVGRIEIRHRDLWPASGNMRDVVISKASGENPAIRFYLGYLQNRPDSIVAALNDIATCDGAVVAHCAAGKDRTGIVVALALAAVGVPREAIIEDYMATGERIVRVSDRLRRSETYRADLSATPDERRMPRLETLERVFAELESAHGSVAAWLASNGFDPAALRARLTG